MKHMKPISQQVPKSADAFQDITCIVVTLMSSVLGALGGAAPILSVLEDKCFIPQPNDDTEA